MSGCYGNNPEDRYFESMLFRYLDNLREDEEDENPNPKSTENKEYDNASTT